MIKIQGGQVRRDTEGEGSRGGHVIGHTKSGEPIYGSPASRPSINHSLLSPSGHMSQRSREQAIKRSAEELFGPGGMKEPSGPQQPTERESDLAQAKRLRKFAALHPKKYVMEAEKLEKKHGVIHPHY